MRVFPSLSLSASCPRGCDEVSYIRVVFVFMSSCVLLCNPPDCVLFFLGEGAFIKVPKKNALAQKKKN